MVILFQLFIKNLLSCFSSFAKRDIMQNSVEMFLSQIVKIHFALTKAFSLCWQQVIWSLTQKIFVTDHPSCYVCGFSLPSKFTNQTNP